MAVDALRSNVGICTRLKSAANSPTSGFLRQEDGVRRVRSDVK